MASYKIDYYLFLYRVIITRKDPSTEGKAILLFFISQETALSKVAKDAVIVSVNPQPLLHKDLLCDRHYSRSPAYNHE